MRILLAIVVLAALAWSGYWFWNASLRERLLTDWLAERRAAGWVAEVDDLRVTGYPNRVDTIATGLTLANPEAGWSWAAQAFEILSLSYRPHHIIAVLPGTQTVSTPVDTVAVESELLRGSVIFVPDTRLVLDSSTFEMTDLRLSSESGWQARIGRALLSIRRSTDPEASFAHDLSFDAGEVAPPAALTEQAGTDRVLPAAIGSLALEAVLDFDRAWDRAAVEGATPVLEAVDIQDVSLDWGPVDIRGQGALTADTQGFAQGTLDIRARNWRALFDVAESSGALRGGLAGTLRAGLDLYARLAGDGDSLELPLRFEDGRAYLGPLPVGPAPRLVQRQ